VNTSEVRDAPGHSIIETVSVHPSHHGTSWTPAIGSELKGLLRRKLLSGADSERVESETARILSSCVPPGARGIQRTGLVIGYVQSGKTLSFTAVTALARDNGYRLVVVLAGTTTNLVEQSYKRLADDLDVEGEGQRIWTLLANPSSKAGVQDDIEQALRNWREYPNRPERCPTVVIVAMKNHRHLKNLAKLLNGCDIDRVSTLIIDDEGDQAGLNNKVRQREESATYSCIRVLRKEFPTHTYLLYTATPQAPLLISRIDMLSPEFADVIEPGTMYVGGEDLFFDKSPFIEDIPLDELPDGDEVHPTPPRSLEGALRLFYVGVAAALVGGMPRGNRSMMIHPSQRTDWHKRFMNWVRSARTNWLGLLAESEGSPDRKTLLADFRDAYDDLSATTKDIPPFDLVARELAYAIQSTRVVEINATDGKLPTVKWNQYYSFILIGGTGLDRGFTVEGLTVTYMPRGAGIGNADTIQQRGRFFGYKRSYLGYLRIFLEQSVRYAFEKYVEHEQSIRTSLVAFRESKKPLSEWRRSFFLDRSMSPTRSSVLALDYYTTLRAKEWTYARRPHVVVEMLERNRARVHGFMQQFGRSFSPAEGSHKRTKEQKHAVAKTFSLEEAYRALLVPLELSGDDLMEHVHALLQIERILKRNRQATCDIYEMSPGTRRERGLDASNAIKNLMQGANEKTGYPGDREIRSADVVTIQLHLLRLSADQDEGNDKEAKCKKRTVVEDVPVVAVAIPEALRADVYAEPERV
jgi:hypothetical protein